MPGQGQFMQEFSAPAGVREFGNRALTAGLCILLFVCALGAGLRAYQNWLGADAGPALSASAKASAARVRAQILQSHARLQASLEEFATNGDANQASARLKAFSAGYVLFQPGGQPASASNAAAVAPARAGYVAAQKAGRAVLLEGKAPNLLIIAARKGEIGAVALFAPDLGSPAYAPLISPATAKLAAGARAAPIGFGGLQIQTRTRQAWQRWAYLAGDGMLALLPLLAGLVLARVLRREQARSAHVAKELERARKRFKVAVNGARAGVFEYSAANEGIFQLSARLCTMLHAASDQLSARAFLGLVAENDRAACVAALAKAGESGVFELAFHVAARPNAIIELRGLAIDSGEGEGLRFVGTALDETPRREAESRASTMERRLRAAIEGYNGPFALWDAKRRLVTCNASYLKAFQLSGHAKPGSPYEVLAAASLSAIRQQRHDDADPHLREIELVSGQWFQVIERVTPDGGLVTVGTNITPLKEHERALTSNSRNMRTTLARLALSEGRNRELAKKYEEEKLRAEEASRAKTAFLANMSHELRTPLNAIIGFSEVVSTEMFGPVGNARYLEYCKDIFSSGQLLLNLINDILDMAKIEAGKFTLDPSPLDPREAIEQAVRWMRRRAEEKGLQLIVENETMGMIEADHRAVQQMLLNLLSNAVKFTQRGAVMIKGRALAGGGVSFTVADTGPGIPPEFLPLLGRPFEQVEISGTTKQSGTGLGLALTRSLAEMHGGELRIESELGRGTMVMITLPARVAAHAQEALG